MVILSIVIPVVDYASTSIFKCKYIHAYIRMNKVYIATAQKPVI